MSPHLRYHCLNFTKEISAYFKYFLIYTRQHTHLPEISLYSDHPIQNDKRDPDDDEHKDAPAQSQAPHRVKDVSIDWRHKGYERPAQDHL